MKRLARPWLWLWPLTAFLACLSPQTPDELNPQPDEHPLNRGNEQPDNASVGGPSSESPVLNLGEDPPAQPQSPATPSAPDPGLGADAGAPPADAGPPPDAGSGLD